MFYALGTHSYTTTPQQQQQKNPPNPPPPRKKKEEKKGENFVSHPLIFQGMLRPCK